MKIHLTGSLFARLGIFSSQRQKLWLRPYNVLSEVTTKYLSNSLKLSSNPNFGTSIVKRTSFFFWCLIHFRFHWFQLRSDLSCLHSFPSNFYTENGKLKIRRKTRPSSFISLFMSSILSDKSWSVSADANACLWYVFRTISRVFIGEISIKKLKKFNFEVIYGDFYGGNRPPRV